MMESGKVQRCFMFPQIDSAGTVFSHIDHSQFGSVGQLNTKQLIYGIFGLNLYHYNCYPIPSPWGRDMERLL